jgi:excisionase family DNA binding protein
VRTVAICVIKYIMGVMNVEEMAKDCGRSKETVRRWIRSGRLKANRRGFKDYDVSPDAWAKFCESNGMQRRCGA